MFWHFLDIFPIASWKSHHLENLVKLFMMIWIACFYIFLAKIPLAYSDQTPFELTDNEKLVPK